MMTSIITGREPRLTRKESGWQKLSLRRLGTILNILPPDAMSLDAAAEMLFSPDFYVRYNAARLLSQRQDPQARLIMQEALTQGNAPVRASVARHLNRYTWFSSEPLFKQALADTDHRVREGAVYALCDLREMNAYHLLVETLQNEVDEVRGAAAFGLRDCPDMAAVRVLEMCLLADDPDVRVKTLEALSANDTPIAARIIHTALDDQDADVQYNAVLSLIEVQREECLPELLDLIATRENCREPLMRGFFHATNYLHLNLTSQVDHLLNVMALVAIDPDPKVRLATIWILSWLRHDAAYDLLWRIYEQEQDGPTKAEMLRIAVNLMNPVGIAMLEDALKSICVPLYEMGLTIQESQRTGLMAQYDETAIVKVKLLKPLLGK